jgi:hypothetical protein
MVFGSSPARERAGEDHRGGPAGADRKLRISEWRNFQRSASTTPRNISMTFLLPSYDRFKRMQTRQMPRRHAGPRLRGDARGRDDRIREELAAGVNNDDARHRSLGGVFSLTRRSKVRFRGANRNICSVRALPVLTPSGLREHS